MQYYEVANGNTALRRAMTRATMRPPPRRGLHQSCGGHAMWRRRVPILGDASNLDRAWGEGMAAGPDLPSRRSTDGVIGAEGAPASARPISRRTILRSGIILAGGAAAFGVFGACAASVPSPSVAAQQPSPDAA